MFGVIVRKSPIFPGKIHFISYRSHFSVEILPWPGKDDNIFLFKVEK